MSIGLIIHCGLFEAIAAFFSPMKVDTEDKDFHPTTTVWTCVNKTQMAKLRL